MAAAQELNSQAAQLFHRGSSTEAEQLWRRALHVAPAWPDLYANLASALVTRSQPARAEAWLTLRAAVRLVPTDGRLYARLGALVVGSQPLAALARPALRMVVRFAHAAARLRPTDGALWCNLGLALNALDARSLARRAYARAVAVSPSSTDARLGLAGTQARSAPSALLPRTAATTHTLSLSLSLYAHPLCTHLARSGRRRCARCALRSRSRPPTPTSTTTWAICCTARRPVAT